MDEEGLLAVGLLDVFVWHAGLEVQDVVCVGPEGVSYAIDLGVLRNLSVWRRWVYKHATHTLSNSLDSLSSSARISTSSFACSARNLSRSFSGSAILIAIVEIAGVQRGRRFSRLM